MVRMRKCLIIALMLGFIQMCVTPPVVSAYVSYKLLNINGYAQEMTNWCWAACEKSILNYLGFSPLPSQYQIVNTVYDPPVNSGATVSQIAGSLRSFGVNAVSGSSSLSFSTIKSEINSLEPIIAGRNGHANLIRGYYEDSSIGKYDVYWIDPWPSNLRYNITAYSSYVSTWNNGRVKDIWI